jgi:hypothetical protein
VTQLGTVLVNTQKPAAPASMALDPGSDSGVKGDNITNVSKPTLIGTAMPGMVITVYDNGTAVGTTMTNATGSWTFTFGTALADGAHVLTATATDVAGNTSSVSNALNIDIDTQAPVLSDASVSSNPFSVSTQGTTTLTMNLSKDAFVSVVILDANGNVVKTLMSQAPQTAGSEALAWDGTDDSGNIVADGTYTFRIDAVDVAGNVSTPQFVTVDKIA